MRRRILKPNGRPLLWPDLHVDMGNAWPCPGPHHFSFFFFWPPRPRMRPARRTDASQRLSVPKFSSTGKLRFSADKAGSRSTVSTLTRWRGARGRTGAYERDPSIDRDKQADALSLSPAGERTPRQTTLLPFPLPAAAPETGNSPNHAVPQLLRERGVAAID